MKNTRKPTSFWKPIKTKLKTQAPLWNPLKTKLPNSNSSLKSVSFIPRKPKIVPAPLFHFKRVRKKDLTYPQAKALYPGLNPHGDADKDGVKNWMDCRPFDKRRQDEKGKKKYIKWKTLSDEERKKMSDDLGKTIQERTNRTNQRAELTKSELYKYNKLKELKLAKQIKEQEESFKTAAFVRDNFGKEERTTFISLPNSDSEKNIEKFYKALATEFIKPGDSRISKEDIEKFAKKSAQEEIEAENFLRKKKFGEVWTILPILKKDKERIKEVDPDGPFKKGTKVTEDGRIIGPQEELLKKMNKISKKLDLKDAYSASEEGLKNIKFKEPSAYMPDNEIKTQEKISSLFPESGLLTPVAETSFKILRDLEKVPPVSSKPWKFYKEDEQRAKEIEEKSKIRTGRIKRFAGEVFDKNSNYPNFSGEEAMELGKAYNASKEGLKDIKIKPYSKYPSIVSDLAEYRAEEKISSLFPKSGLLTPKTERNIEIVREMDKEDRIEGVESEPEDYEYPSEHMWGGLTVKEVNEAYEKEEGGPKYKEEAEVMEMSEPEDEFDFGKASEEELDAFERESFMNDIQEPKVSEAKETPKSEEKSETKLAPSKEEE